ncbi:MAG: OmpA family protein [Bacteroidales bacterium]|nr:OmpA family protein [Bacteroidales bacterium]MDD4673832.1 OmpA family protein [Bacteroidales bacterium]MDY0347745.1 OmpA family protein [Tenuifilaceae bacterium]
MERYRIRLCRILLGTVIIFTTCIAGKAFSQDSDYKTTFADAEYYFLFNDVKEALPLYLKLIDRASDNANLSYRAGCCYLNIDGVKHKAIPYLQKAVKNINTSYQEGSYKETGAPPNAYFYLGEAYRIDGKFDEALEAYNSFKELLDSKDVYNIDYVNVQIDACNRASEVVGTGARLQSEIINLFPTQKFSFGGVMSYDQRAILFTVREKFYDAIYITRKDSLEEWGTPENITLALGVEGEVSSTSINADGTQIFLFKNDNGIGNIYTSKRINGQWQRAQKMGKPINSRFWETSASISADGQFLFFSSNRRGGYGGLDLYYCKRNPNGEWGRAKNLGSNINTPHNEEAPFLSADGNKLYFISQGHNSLGGYDVFYSEKTDDEQWATPINVGYPVSTPDDDMWYFPVDNSRGLVSLVEKNNPNTSNLYLVSIVEGPEVQQVKVKGNLLLSDNFEVQGNLFNISVIDGKSKDTLRRVVPEDFTGNFSFVLAPGAYDVVAEGQNYLSQVVPLAIPDDYPEPSTNINFKLNPQEGAQGNYYAVKSVLFDYNSDLLSERSIHELEKLYNFLYDYPSVELQICGHTDNIGSLEFNQVLSLRRANAVVKYLVQRGIDPSRLNPCGASFLENVALNTLPDGADNPAGRQLNRRTSVRELNPNNNVKLINELDVPEHLKVKVQHYTVMLAPVNTPVDAEKLLSLRKVVGFQSYRLVGKRNKFVYAIGQFNRKSDAIFALNQIVKKGFPEAVIIGKDDLSKFME